MDYSRWDKGNLVLRGGTMEGIIGVFIALSIVLQAFVEASIDGDSDNGR